MPLSQKELEMKVASGKPFIVGTYLGVEPSELMCKVKGRPDMKENRVIRKHTVKNRNGLHVYSEFMQPGSRVEKDTLGNIVKVFDEKGKEVNGTLKVGQEVVVDLWKFERDGVGIDIMGEVKALS